MEKDKETLLMNGSFLFLLFHKIFLLQLLQKICH